MGQMAKTNEAMCELELKDVRKYQTISYIWGFHGYDIGKHAC
jgi:hypothetical protein